MDCNVLTLWVGLLGLNIQLIKKRKKYPSVQISKTEIYFEPNIGYWNEFEICWNPKPRGSSHQRAGFSPASAVWPSRGLHILERDKAEKPTGIDVYEFVPFASDFLLTFKLDGESCLFLQLFCQNQLLQRRASWAAAGRGFSPADGGSHLYLPSLFPL